VDVWGGLVAALLTRAGVLSLGLHFLLLACRLVAVAVGGEQQKVVAVANDVDERVVL
jgi:hypothetical protein